MIVLDRLLIGGIRFVLDKVAATVEAELNDESRLREELLAAQMRLELGEMAEDDFAALERDLLARLREIKEREREAAAQAAAAGGMGTARVSGVEVDLELDRERR